MRIPLPPGRFSFILMSEEGAKKYRKNWARLIQKIYEADPLTCPKCQGRMKIVSFIEDDGVIEKILKQHDDSNLESSIPKTYLDCR